MKVLNADELWDYISENQISDGKDLLETINFFPTFEININKPQTVDYGIILKLCPFCGGEASFKITETSQHIMCVNIVCGMCGCQTKLYSDPNDPLLEKESNKAIRNATKAWNRRIGHGRERK